MADIRETIQGLYSLKTYLASKAIEEHGPARESLIGMQKNVDSAVNLLKEREAVEPKTIPEELKLKMWNAFYAEEDKLEEKYVGTKEHNSWFLIYRPWLQVGFNLAIKVIADWEGL